MSPTLVRTAAIACLVFFVQSSALADFRLCNNTPSRIGVAVGHRDPSGWLTEGWWNVAARSCETILKGPLVARYYYIYAVDYDQSGEWSGKSFMCTRDKAFTIRGLKDCLERGHNRQGFIEIDTGHQPNWIVQLSEKPHTTLQPGTETPPLSKTPAPQAPAVP